MILKLNLHLSFTRHCSIVCHLPAPIILDLCAVGLEDRVSSAIGAVIHCRAALFGWGLGLVVLAAFFGQPVFVNEGQGVEGIATFFAVSDTAV